VTVRERTDRLRRAMQDQDLGLLLLTLPGNVAYATGITAAAADADHVLLERLRVLVTPDDDPRVLDAEVPHAEVASLVREQAPDARLGVDDLSPELSRLLDEAGIAAIDPSTVLSAAKAVKTAEEVSLIAEAQRINEEAGALVREACHAGVPATDLTGLFLEAALAAGADASVVDPIWQAMPASVADGPFSVTGWVVFPTATTGRPFETGDVVWVDTGISVDGYLSDYGRTWLVDSDPTPRQQDHAQRWRDVADRVLDAVKPGATAADLTRAAQEAGEDRPWLPHLYLAHGSGTESAEMPFVGTDLGPDFDATIVLEPGMVLVLEPVIWDDGHAGYRAEEIVVVTDDGWQALSSLPHEPFT